MMPDDFCAKYLEIASGELSGLNLTRVLDPTEFKIKQYEDSVIPVRKSTKVEGVLRGTELHVDIGFGGGFPLLPIHNEMEGIKSIGFEARRKKSDAVMKIAEQLGYTDVKTYHERIEDIILDRRALITFKAVSTIKNCLSLLNSDQEVSVLFYKGPGLEQKEGLDFGIDKKRWKIEYDDSFDVEGNLRRFIMVKGVPRRTKRSKKLVNLSSFL